MSPSATDNSEGLWHRGTQAVFVSRIHSLLVFGGYRTSPDVYFKVNEPTAQDRRAEDTLH